jgi:hypothetical protein
MSKFHLMDDGTEVGIVYKSSDKVPIKMTKTIYNLGGAQPKTPEDFSGRGVYGCLRDFHLVGYSASGSPIMAW